MSNGEGCKTCSSGQNGSCSQAQSVEDNALVGCFNNVKNMIAVMSGKGGVGKSTVSSLLALSLRQKGYEVGILDADITGPSIPKAFGIARSPGVTPFGIQPPETKTGIKLMSINLLLPNEDDPIIWRGPLLAGGVKQFWEETDWRELDFMIVDLPPGTGDVPLTVLQSLPVTGVVIVTSPQDLVSMVVKKSIKMTQKLEKPVLGLIENMSGVVCPCCGNFVEVFGQNRGQKVAEEMNIPYLGSLRWDPELIQMADEGTIEAYRLEEIEGITARLIEEIKKLAGDSSQA